MTIIRERTKLIVGLDYGTTYSGLSFALSNAADFKDIIPWTKYPGASSHCAEHAVKAPSRVAFSDENPELEGNAWGYQIEPGMKTYAWTKLLLDNSSLQSDYDDPELYLTSGAELMQLPSGKSAKDVATEFLRGMHEMFQDAVIDRLGANKLDNLPTEFWLTVPATWSEKAKLLTKKAAHDAGFGKRSIDQVMLIAEPEAAAHLALKSSLHHLEDFVKPNSGVMVCDCGGGTVDITTYEVEETKPTLKLREVAVGVAGKCGGTAVDRNLFRLLGERFGEAFTSLGLEQIGPGSSFMDQFEMKKKDFSVKSPSRRAHRLPLHMPLLSTGAQLDKYYEKRSSSVLLTQADYQELFDPVIDTVIKLVEDQVEQIKAANERLIDTIVLVGGFGSSPYLKERLGDWCSGRNIRLTTPLSGAWSAVVCGAVLRGLEGSIVREKKCRRHYGHMLASRYIPSLHQDYDKKKRCTFVHPWTNAEYLTGFMFWEIKKGIAIDGNTEVNSEFTINPEGVIAGSYTHTLYCCSLDEAPATIENERIEEVGEVRYSLQGVDQEKLPYKLIDDVRSYDIPLTLNMRMNDEVGHLVFRILFDGKEIGKAEIDLDHS